MNVPKIRINGFEGEWKRVKLAECLNISNETNKDNVYGKDDVLSVSDEIGVVNQIKHLGRSYAGKSVTNYGILKKGQIVYTKSPLKAKPFGIIKQNLGDSGIVSVLYAIYDAKEGVDAGYIHYYFDPAWRLNAYIRPLVNKGAKNTMNISDETALEGYIYLPPTLAEQQQIAEYFGRLDSLIEATGKKVASLKQTKQACLQSMFPQPGETTPRIRFKGFEGDWEKKQIGDISTSSKGNGYSKADLRLEGTPIVLYGRMYTKYSFEMDNVDTFATPKDGAVYSKGNEVVIPASGETAEDIAIAAAIKQSGVILGGDLNILTFDDDYLPSFMALCISNSETHYELSKYAQGKSVVHLRNNDIAKGTVTCPSLAEQQQIASFFSNLDKQIALQEQQLEKLKQVKAACLDNMFV